MIENQLYKILSSKIFSYPKKRFWKFLKSYLKSRQMRIVIIDEPFAQTKEIKRERNQTKEIKRERKMLLKNDEARNIYLAVISTEHIPGDIAEVGVYQGASAKLLCEAKKGKHLHLFDTFEGLPPLSQEDNSLEFHETQFAYSLGEVQRYLVKYKKVYFHKGIVPLSAKPVEKNRFSFVHLDVDLYKSTLDCLSFFTLD